MIKIEIYEEATDTLDMVDLLNTIATRVKEGYLTGETTGLKWKIIGEPERKIEYGD